MTTTLYGTLRYDGTDFAGWQAQPGRPTVQASLAAALSRVANQPIKVTGAGRTDAGVHALGQAFSCEWPGEPPRRLRHALSQMLAPRIQVTHLQPAAPDFNARFDATGKRYVYSIDLGREADPLATRYAWHVPLRVDTELVAALLPQLAGTHDFAGFQSTGAPPMRSTVRTLHAARLLRGGAIGPVDSQTLWRLEFEGDGFLFHMVRNLTGTLIEIGRGRFPAEFLAEQLAGGGPFLGHCAPAQGLCLAEVFYPAERLDPLAPPRARAAAAEAAEPGD